MNKQSRHTSTLSFTSKMYECDEGGRRIKYCAFFYAVDGITIDASNDEYNPANCLDVIDADAEKQNLVILWHCGCGIWQCASLVAYVKEIGGDVIEWEIRDYRSSQNFNKYYFRKDEYLKTMSKIKALAQMHSEELYKKTEK